ncbi:hypothetical protein GCM10023085_25410 [Actinomadura viridis]|uniref:Uncharacterized protein n=1 Tax=Actinomadura viridis TaxID=58110 RepID=A0A931DGM3_9ACTN|nr:hypothetical protein [Actinomadura viridis]
MPGTTLYWKLSHCGRKGTHTMAVDIGPPDGTPNNERQEISDGQEWRHHHGEYTVPFGQTVTRFAFRSVGGIS